MSYPTAGKCILRPSLDVSKQRPNPIARSKTWEARLPHHSQLTFALLSYLLLGLLFCFSPARAADVTLRLHSFLPPSSTVPKQILRPWAQKVEEASKGRIKIQHFDSMALGGKPPSLMDQARDGVVDITWTLLGYTPGRFPRSEVFELPFLMEDPVATSLAFWDLIEQDFQHNEFKSVKVLGAWVHGPGVLHSKVPIQSLSDMKGLKLRGPTRVINAYFKSVGAVPLGLPLPAVPEALSRGVISATALPWEVTPAVKLSELVSHHSELKGPQALYTATLVLVMNKARYRSLPDDLKAILDAESGAKLSGFGGRVQWAADEAARIIAEKAGNSFHALADADYDAWKKAAEPVYADWIVDMQKKGIDGKALIERVRARIQAHRNQDVDS
ncbi:MAG: TRAP transporter substrate-binding protein [Cohaesibacter sp.]|nr:TRAP transporter substrate-binding protein [Cohaesibacter sp.]MCV6601008.1 TRAP transporter substrate-binding protein [Cohaesibacter sp.]